MANLTVTANFAADTFTLTYTAGTGGTLTGNTPRRSTTARTARWSQQYRILATTSWTGATAY